MNVIALSYHSTSEQPDMPFGAIHWCIAADLKEKLPGKNLQLLQWPH